jgi:hypothetical protein
MHALFDHFYMLTLYVGFELREQIQEAGGNCMKNVMGLFLMVG